MRFLTTDRTIRLLLIAAAFGFLTPPSSAQSGPENGTTLIGDQPSAQSRPEKRVTLDGNQHSAPAIKEASVQEPAMRSGAMNLDLNYPGAGLRYFLSGKTALEVRAQDGGGNLAVGPRLYLYPALFSTKTKFSPYLCVEGDYISFKGTSSKGSGWGGGAFVGIEYALSRSFSLQIDTGGLYLDLKDKGTSIAQNDFEFTLNFGINFYIKSGNSQLPEVP